MLVMMVVAVAPGIEREMCINADQFSHYCVGGHAREEGKMGHIVELHEKPQNHKHVQAPAEKFHAYMYHTYRDCSQSKRYSEGYRGLPVIGLTV